MQYKECNTINNYDVKYSLHRYNNEITEVVLLIPYAEKEKVLIGVNRTPFLDFMLIPSQTVTTYLIFECDWKIRYNRYGSKFTIYNESEVQQRLFSFSKMVMDILNSAGTEILGKTQDDKIILNYVKFHKNEKDLSSLDHNQFAPESFIINKDFDGSYYISINGKVIFKTNNIICLNNVWQITKQFFNRFTNCLTNWMK